MDSGDPPRRNRTRDGVEAGMQELWSSTSYEAHLLSLPFALAPTAMFARDRVHGGDARCTGAARLAHPLRRPVAVQLVDDALAIDRVAAVAEQLFRLSACTIPLAAATETGFQIA